MIEGRGGGKEHEAPAHLIVISELSMLRALLKIGITTRYMYVHVVYDVAKKSTIFPRILPTLELFPHHFSRLN